MERGAFESPGTTIAGRYELVERLGEGGMGTVWRARQHQPIERTVALKVIKAGMDTEQVIASFDAERQTLALMDHPNIAKVLDAGATAQGRPFFVMELVAGVPIHEYCDANLFPVRSRLELFVRVCGAVQHAHQKGIIHRDLKPANVLVADYDGEPMPKIIDFGIAKAIGPKLTERTMFGGLDGIVGTLDYMAPEQATLGSQNVDTRADVYSLGVLLYELLTGSVPASWQHLSGEAIPDALRAIREDRPPMPSTRLHESSGRIEEIAAARRSDPTRLPRELRGDLDWIVMRALEKDPDRRYGTANDLARDVERHLAGDPVEAGPPTIGYRLRTYAKKYRAAVLSVAVLALTVLAGAGVATWQAVRATRAERLALAERDHARSVADLLRSVFGNLDPYVELAPGETPVDKLVEALEAAAARLTDAPATDPFIRRELQHTLALCLIGLGEFETAIPLVEAATAELDPNDPAGLDVWQVSAALQMRIGRLDECLATMERIEARFADALTADALSSLRENRARVLCQVERYDAAIPLLEQRLVDLGESGDSLRTRQGLAVALRGAGRTDEAIAAFDEVLRESERRYGTDHPWTTMSRNGLAVAYSAAGRYDEAIELLESVEASAGGLPEYHLDRISVRVNLATAYSKVGRADEARELLASCYERMLAKHGIGHHRTRDAACALADVCCNLGDVDAALTALAALTARFLEDDTTGDPRLLGTLDLVVAKLFQQRRAAEALPLIRAVHARRVEIDGERAAATLHSADSLASCHWMAGELEQSIPLFERTLEGCRATFGDRSERTLHVVTNLAVNYTSGGRFRDAEELTAEFLDEFEAAHGAHGRPTLMLHDLRCQALVRLDDPSRAAPVIEAMIERLEAAGIEGRATHWRDALARLERR